MVGGFLGKTSRGVAAAAAILAVIGLVTAARPAHAWVSPGAAVGIGLGAFALGTALANPYYNPYYYPYSYYGYYYPPAPGYYPTAPYYPPSRTCWNPYYRNYYAC
jgi:hypothetical protein